MEFLAWKDLDQNRPTFYLENESRNELDFLTLRIVGWWSSECGGKRDAFTWKAVSWGFLDSPEKAASSRFLRPPPASSIASSCPIHGTISEKRLQPHLEPLAPNTVSAPLISHGAVVYLLRFASAFLVCYSFCFVQTPWTKWRKRSIFLDLKASPFH